MSTVSRSRDPDLTQTLTAWEEVVPQNSSIFLSREQIGASGGPFLRPPTKNGEVPAHSFLLLLCLQNPKPWHLKRLNKSLIPRPSGCITLPLISYFPPAPTHSWSTVGNLNCNLYCPALKGWACFLSQGQSLLNVLPPFEMNPPTLPLSPTVSFPSPPPSTPGLLFLIKPHPGCWEGRGKDSEDFRAAGSGGLQPHVFL